MTALVSNQLVERSEPKQVSLLAILFLEEGHDQCPKERLDDTAMLLG